MQLIVEGRPTGETGRTPLVHSWEDLTPRCLDAVAFEELLVDPVHDSG